ncbi:Hypothetical protein HVR_LOCUS1094 [uncultured virus]|nr:Hypothetical protein HVR_LOCUS1094 [uncultured virus]
MAAFFTSRLFATNPLRLYGQIAAWGFGFTFGSNLIGSNLTNDPPLRIKEHPHPYTFMLLCKSLQNGILWPAIPFKIAQDPSEFFILGKGCANALDQLEPIINELRGMKIETPVATFVWGDSTETKPNK